MKIISKILIALLVTFSAIILLQLWLNIFSAVVFYKITVTLAIVFLVIVATMLIAKYFKDEKELKKDKFID